MEFNDDDIYAITENVWGAVLALAVAPAPPTAATEGDADWLIGGVDIRGEWNGTILVHCPTALAQRVAGIMFDVDPAAATPGQVEDAVCQVTNMTGGNVKSLLPEPCHLDLPRMLRGDERARLLAMPAATRVGFECGAATFVVSIHPDPDVSPAVHASI